MEKAEARLQDGFQVHHLIPDKVAQGHKLIQEVLRRLKDYTIDRGSNLIDMPSSLEQSQGGIVHRGSHPNYDRFVLQKLDTAMRSLTEDKTRPIEDIEPKLLDDALRKIEDELRRRIETGDLPPGVLKELQQGGIPAGSKLSWNDTQGEDIPA